MSIRMWKTLSAGVALAALALVFAVVTARGGAEVSAQIPDDSETLSEIKDELALMRSQVSGISDDVKLAQGQIGGVRDELALMRNQVGRLARSIASSDSDPAVYTRAFVEKAISRYESTGREATAAYYNTPESVDRDWYVFIIDENDMFLSHPTVPEYVGTDVKDIRGSDDSYPIGLAISGAASQSGSWVDYTFRTPSGDMREKHSWIVRHDGLIFGSGWYEDGPNRVSEPGEFTEMFVRKAVQLHETAGRNAAFAHYNSPQSVVEDWYVFVIENGRILVHPTPTTIGQSLTGPLGTDIRGKDFGAQMLAADENGIWVDYVFQNPADDNKYERKHSYVVEHDGLIYGSGWYERNVDLRTDSAEFTKAYVEEAIRRYDADGREAALAYYNSSESVIGDWYMFIIDENDLTVANGNVPARVGMDIKDRVDPNGYPHGRVISTAADEDGAWVSYVLESPTTNEARVKHSWLVRHNGLIFGSGWYEDGISKSGDPAKYTRAYVDMAIQMHDTLGRQAAIDYYNSSESVIDDWYMFIIGENDRIVAHGNVPAHVGTDLVAPNGYPVGRVISAAADEDGEWVSYAFDSPTTNEARVKHSWTVRHSGLIFASGWYEDGTSKSDAPAEYTRAYVDMAIQMYDTLGRQAAIDYYKTQQSVDGNWYASIIDERNVLVSHPDAALIGTNTSALMDSNGYPIGPLATSASEEGSWIDYDYTTPAGEVQSKHALLVRHDGLIFSSGWYEAAPSKTAEPGAFTKRFVERALQLYDIGGRERAFSYYNSSESVDGEWYLFVIDPSGAIVVQGSDPSVRGQNVNGPIGTDVSGKDFGAEILAADENGAWVDYMFENPTTGEVGQKRSWVVKRDGLIFGAGWYDD